MRTVVHRAAATASHATKEKCISRDAQGSPRTMALTLHCPEWQLC